MILRIFSYVITFILGSMSGVFFLALCSANGRDVDEFTGNTYSESDEEK